MLFPVAPEAICCRPPMVFLFLLATRVCIRVGMLQLLRVNFWVELVAISPPPTCRDDWSQLVLTQTGTRG